MLKEFELFRITQSKERIYSDSPETMDIIRIETRTSGLAIDIAPNGRIALRQTSGAVPYGTEVMLSQWLEENMKMGSFLKELNDNGTEL